MLAILEHLHAVHEHMHHANRVLMRLIEGRTIVNRCGIEHDDVGITRCSDAATIFESPRVSGQLCHATNRIGKTGNLLLAHIPAEKTREVSVGAGMWIAQ